MLKRLFDAARGLKDRITGRRSFQRTSHTFNVPARKTSPDRPLYDFRPRSRADRRRRADAIATKNALGSSFFTRKLNPRTRARRVSELKPWQRALARDRGWI